MTTQTPAATTSSKPRIRVLGSARYLVESKSRPGLGHQVDVLRLKCSCEAGKHGMRCHHLVTAIQYDAWRKRQREEAAHRKPMAPVAVPAFHETAGYKGLAEAFGE